MEVSNGELGRRGFLDTHPIGWRTLSNQPAVQEEAFKRQLTLAIADLKKQGKACCFDIDRVFKFAKAFQSATNFLSEKADIKILVGHGGHFTHASTDTGLMFDIGINPQHANFGSVAGPVPLDKIYFPLGYSEDDLCLELLCCGR